jgi:hypothetical protein
VIHEVIPTSNFPKHLTDAGTGFVDRHKETSRIQKLIGFRDRSITVILSAIRDIDSVLTGLSRTENSAEKLQLRSDMRDVPSAALIPENEKETNRARGVCVSLAYNFTT